jgi:hypothetical protein
MEREGLTASMGCTMVADDFSARLVTEFISIATKTNAEGWIEYLLWETVEGLRDRPFKLLEPMSDEEMDVLRLLRDEAEIWVAWVKGQWCTVPIEDWRQHAAARSADDVLVELHRG